MNRILINIKKRNHLIFILTLSLIFLQTISNANTYHVKTLPINETEWDIIDRGTVSFNNTSVLVQECFIALKDTNFSNHEINLQARASKGSEQVQIWAGFHFQDRNTRYAIGLRGGNCDDLYFCRYTPNGTIKC